MPYSMNLAKAQSWGDHRPQGELITTIVVLNGHTVKLFPKYSCLYPLVIREDSYCHAQWLIQKPTTSQSAKNKYNTALNEMSRSIPVRLRHIREQSVKPEHREMKGKKRSSGSSMACTCELTDAEVICIRPLPAWACQQSTMDGGKVMRCHPLLEKEKS